MDNFNYIGTSVYATTIALDLKAPIAGPTFTGTPAAPTAAAGTNTTQLATTAFVKTAVDNLVDSAPGALDTLNELAEAIGDDSNYAATVTTALAGKQATIGDGDLTIARTNGLQAALDQASSSVIKPTMTIPEMSSGNILLNFTEGIKDVATYDKDDFVLTNEGTVISSNSISVENDKVKFAFGVVGHDWTEDTSTGRFDTWRAITSSADGTKLAAGANGNTIYTSSDSGATWTANASLPNKAWFALASSADGTKLVAGVFGGSIWTSSDSGATWTENTTSPGGGKLWHGIASSADGTKLAAVVNGGNIYTSTDSGATWTVDTSVGSTKGWASIKSSDDGTKLIASTENDYIWYSTNSGVTWTAATTSTQATRYGITLSADGTKAAAGVQYSGNIWTSTDGGATWTENTTSPGATKNWYAMAGSSDGTKLVAAVYDGNIWTSTDSGATWTEDTAVGANKEWWKVTMSADGTKFAAVIGSSQGKIWTKIASIPGPTITDVQNLTVKYTKSATANKNLIGKDSDVAVDTFDFVGTNRTQTNITSTVDVSMNNLWVEGDISCNSTLKVDTINENTDTSGVTIDSVLLKDNTVTAHTITAMNYAVGSTNFISASRQGNFRDLEVKDTNNNATILLVGDGGDITIDGTLSADTIGEKTSATGVTIDGVLLKDNDISANGIQLDNLAVRSGGYIFTNTISETTNGSGITIDGVLLKDGGITATGTTQTAGNNTTQLATTAFVKTAIDNLVDSAPGALDTLNELAAAIGDDANYAATVTTALAGKQASITTSTRLNANLIHDGSVTNTIFGRLANVTDDIQAQLNAKQASLTSTGSGEVITLLERTNLKDVSDNAVRITENQTIAGVKTFTSDITGTLAGKAATADALHTARTIHGVSFNGTADIDLSEVIADTVGAMFSSNTETGITATYEDSDNTIDLIVGTLNQDTTGNAATVTNGVYTTGNQTIAGTKTFSSTISGSIDGNAATVTNGVYTTGVQTVAGAKTFSSAVTVGNYTLPTTAGTQGQVLKYPASGSTLTWGTVASGGGGGGSSTTKKSQILESLIGVCDGRVIQGESASYTYENVTTSFNTSTTWTKITGSGISYKPPTGTKQVVFELIYAFKGSGSGSFEPLFATKLKIGSSYAEGQEFCYRESSGGYPEAVISNKFILDINSSHTESITNGKLSSWNTNRDLQVDIRSYVGYAVKIHALRHDDAVNDGGSAGYFRAPLLKIVAIGEETTTGGGGSSIDNTTDVSMNDLEVFGDISCNAIKLGGHIIPDTNAAYDLGNAEYKIRHLFLSDNSLWVGDNHKIDIVGGKMKFKKRKTNVVPASIVAAGGDIAGALAATGVGAVQSMSLKHWHDYAKTLNVGGGVGQATIDDLFVSGTAGDWEEDEDLDNSVKLSGDQTIAGSKTFSGTTKINAIEYESETVRGNELDTDWNVVIPWKTSTDKRLYYNDAAVGIDKTYAGYTLDVGGSIRYTSGGLNGSDNRLKHNEVLITNGLATINKLQVKHYIKTKTLYDNNHNFNLDASGIPLDSSGNKLELDKDYTIETGIIAQEIRNIPELEFVVRGDEETDHLALDYNSIHCTHIAATKELNNKVTELEAKVASQETLIQTLIARIEALENN